MFAAPRSTPGVPRSLALVRDLAQIGVLLLMFVAGLETDLGADAPRRQGRLLVRVRWGRPAVDRRRRDWPWPSGSRSTGKGIFIGTILTATSVSISAQTLLELARCARVKDRRFLGPRSSTMSWASSCCRSSWPSRRRRRPGRGLVAQSRSLSCASSCISSSPSRAALVCRSSALGVVGLPSARRCSPQAWSSCSFMRGRPSIVGGVAAITGAYLAGVLIAQTEFKKDIDAGIHPLTYSMFVPMFFISIGLEANGRALGDRVPFTMALMLVAIVAKADRLWRVCPGSSASRNRESVRVGVGMISRGEVGLIVAGYGLAERAHRPGGVFSLGHRRPRDDDGNAAAAADGVSASRVRAVDGGGNDCRPAGRRRGAARERHRN